MSLNHYEMTKTIISLISLYEFQFIVYIKNHGSRLLSCKIITLFWRVFFPENDTSIQDQGKQIAQFLWIETWFENYWKTLAFTILSRDWSKLRFSNSRLALLKTHTSGNVVLLPILLTTFDKASSLSRLHTMNQLSKLMTQYTYDLPSNNYCFFGSRVHRHQTMQHKDYLWLWHSTAQYWIANILGILSA